MTSNKSTVPCRAPCVSRSFCCVRSCVVRLCALRRLCRTALEEQHGDVGLLGDVTIDREAGTAQFWAMAAPLQAASGLEVGPLELPLRHLVRSVPTSFAAPVSLFAFG